MSYSSAEEQLIDQQGNEKKCFRLATVTAVDATTGAPTIKFYGEETSSQKTYNFLKTYTPVVDDVVLLAAMNNSYVILGSTTVEVSGDSAVTKEQMDAAIEEVITGLDLANTYAPKTHTHDSITNGSWSLRLGDFSVYPSNSSVSLGTQSYSWSKIYCDDIYRGTSPLYHDRIYQNTSNSYVQMTSAALIPSGNGKMLGNSNNRWSELYASSATINTSDRRQKKNIQDIPKKYMKFFKLLKPKRFKMKDGKSDRYHVGYIAQDIEESMKECNISDKEFAGYIRMPVYDKYVDGEPAENAKVIDYEYGLRYGEFIALNTMMIQQLIADNENLKERVTALERRLNNDTTV